MADVRDPAGAVGKPDHSTLEVVEGPDQDKASFNKNDKVAYVPSRGDDKMVVQHDAGAPKPVTTTPSDHPDQCSSPQTTFAAGASTWDGDAFSAREPPGTGGGKSKKILGLRRRTFFILMWALSFLVAIGIGVGVGVGVSMHSNNNNNNNNNNGDSSDGAAAEESDSSIPPRTTTSPGTGSAGDSSVTASPTSSRRTTTGSASSVTAPRSTAAVQIGGIGGRCSDVWGPDCICLERDVCVNRWQGETYTGNGPEDWPCPDDPPSIVACIVKPCLGKPEGTQCMWTEACREPDNSTTTAPRCPGGEAFVCCEHTW
ncbi:hypothetical protein VTH82DRAFT_7228 [Thermothelomyces myriococcoides]